MGLLTIGAFARASRLSPKALRLYDDLGLLPPARVDPATGYRFYAPGQLERARLVAWLRRVGMPLARIRRVCELHDTAPPAAAEEVRAFWSESETAFAARRELAAFLVDHLSWKDHLVMTTPDSTPPRIRCAALSDTGSVRTRNQDTAYAGPRLLAVADGYGEHGERAGAAAVEALKGFEDPGVGDLLNALQEAVERADRAVRDVAAPDGTTGDSATADGATADASAASGTTLTALLLTGSRMALVHIGDSRAYLLRGGEFFQITHDHTLVRAMVEQGALTPEEAASHPQRALLLRALGAGERAVADVRLREVRTGDRYLLCSDGLSAVVPDAAVRRVASAGGDPEGTVRELVALAHASGAPDNVSCVVADVHEAC
ncbi:MULTISPECIES: MerR family transcriptional regulator [Streptomyces]|uniref:MerR family transcriptional regulator n=1 Tax=Streptomyces TaxID=1883 RepID=UPI00163B8CF9|nr:MULTISPECIES: MerR family transcriptional regulator [Streptomyces]MBC2878990.1 MerR family transcriptional regulator [Streptomyces sp. TYQ1024]UBI40660.1 MerR family transcriptional regulator [Streptomyces mobaraensis]UKW33243.1 MerR family transcriptional regulator [Streptomyces sp. TYQ1024]